MLDRDRGVRVVPYRSYLKYAALLLNQPDPVALQFPSFFLQRYAKTYDKNTGQMEPLVLEPWQTFAIDDPSGQAVWLKPRQVGFSFLRAGRGLALSLLRPNYTAVFVSYNRDEAKNKIIYARSLYESMQYRGKPLLKSDNMAELRFNNGSRIVSFPAKAVRGYAEPDIFADEAAFIPGASDIFSGTLSSGVRGGGTFTAGSTPYGDANFFAELFRNEGNRFPSFVRHRIEWWYSPAMCVDVPGALMNAPQMTTADRVAAYGTDKLKEIFSALSLADFQREHECSFDARDDTVISRAQLMDAARWPERDDGPDVEADPDLGRLDCVVESWQSPLSLTLDREILPAIARAIRAMHPTSTFAAGYDVARVGDNAELIILEERRDGERIQRAQLAFHDFDWPLQEQMLKGVAADRQCRRLAIDSAGIGDKLASDVRRAFVREGTPAHEGKVIGVSMQRESERAQVFHAVIQAVQALDVRLYANEDLFRHFSAFRRDPEAGAFADRFQLKRGRNKDGSQHHGDVVVALGLALWDYAVRTPQKRRPVREQTVPAVRGAAPVKKLDFGRYQQHPSGLYVPQTGLFHASK